ncbi:aldehyde dehydrogenase family protein [Microbacterium sp. A94]|uniref:aldehyde dehydrogenase family protein n=1 Tax=Microbacterium sp. A94 TaxID=3450717 RepID=UPI003F43278F
MFMSNALSVERPLTEPVGREELERILSLQRAAFLKEGRASAEVRRDRIDRLCLAILTYANELSDAMDLDFGQRPHALSKAFEVVGWLADAKVLRESLEEWMKPIQVAAGFIQQKSRGVIGVIGAWNFPIASTVQPALAALAAGNRVVLKCPDFHVRTGKVLAKAVAEFMTEDEATVVLGDLKTAETFSELPFDGFLFTGSPRVGRLVAAAAAKNLVPIVLELGGKNPAVVARDADLDLAARRIAQTRAINGGQVCLCPEYVFVPRESLDVFVEKVLGQFMDLFPDYLNNPGVVSIVNNNNYDRIVGLIDDAVANGARKLEAVNDDEAASLPSREGRRIAPTVLLDVPEAAKISSEEIFGPVLPIYVYDDIEEVVEYVSSRPSPLSTYWFGEDTVEFRRFLDYTTSGGVTRNDGMVHANVEGAPFGGVGNSGYGAYHGKAGFDQFTHSRMVATASPDAGAADNLVGRALASDGMNSAMDGLIEGAIDDIRSRIG